ncbi:MAG: PEP-CTERM sorting domain-containing protein [Planctomycetota bacterium]|nr:PEP-CTERM sorting domain-containing protein [Planctomycetota bacterium]
MEKPFMRHLLVLLIVGLVLVVSSPAWAVSIAFNQPWNGPIVLHLTNYDMGTIYSGPPGTYGRIDTAAGLLAFTTAGGTVSKAPVNMGDDGWGVFRVDQILTAKVLGPNQIQATGTELWANGNGGAELVGMFHGLYDVNLRINPDGSQTVDSKGMLYDFYAQTLGTFNPSLGSAGRIGPGAYTTVGLPGLVAGASNWVGGAAATGFIAPLTGIAPPDIEQKSGFDPALAVPFAAGRADVFFNVLHGDLGPGKPTTLDTNFFKGTDSTGPTTADIYLAITTYGNNVGNVPGAFGGFDWTVTSSDPASAFIVPEPVTMAGLLMGIGCLGRYIRKRR